MHALVRAVLLGMAWPDAFNLNTESQPPDGQLTEPVDRMGRGERDAFVGPNDLRQPKLLERPLEGGKGEFLLCREQRLARER